MSRWKCVLHLNSHRSIIDGGTDALCTALSRGGDLRIGTEFRHNEHIDTESDSSELIEEVAEFGVTMVIDKRWSAGIMSLRQPIDLPEGFGPRPSMSFFLYNQDGTQGIARPYLDGLHPFNGTKTEINGSDTGMQFGRSPDSPPPRMPRYHVLDTWDSGTNGPSQNFIYDFETFRFCVNDSWQEVLSHDETGGVTGGSLNALTDAFRSGCSIRMGISGLCNDLIAGSEGCRVPHEVFIQGGSAYHYTDRRLFIIGSHPVVRIEPSVPLRYSSRNWDFGWLMLRTDGKTVYRRCDPWTLQFSDQTMHLPIRWFVR
jgi:hypothetical protein